VLELGDAKETTPTINKTLNPEWNTTVELPVVDGQSLLLEVQCWDKDRFGKDYMGEFDVILEDVFADGLVNQNPQWFPLESRRSGRKKSVVSGEIQLQFALVDPADPAATPEQMLQKFIAIASQNTDDDDDDEELLARADSNATDVDDDDEDESSDEAQDETKKAAKKEKRRRKLKLHKLKRKAKGIRTYGFPASNAEVAGVLFLEIQKATDLPPERNVTRTSFDMDPFVVTSLGKKTYRTKTISHNLNPIFDEKLIFQVLTHETNYSVNFTVIDKDKFSSNDYVGTVNFPLQKAISTAPQEDPETGLYRLPEPSDSPGVSPSGSESRRSRFRLPMSRSSSTHSMSRLGRPSLKKENSAGSLATYNGNGALSPNAHNTATDSSGNLAVAGTLNINSSEEEDEELKLFTLPLELKHAEKWDGKHDPTLYIRARYLPYKALRQQFWRAMLKQYDADESGLLDKVELTTMLDTLGSTLRESTVDGFFERFARAHNGEHLLTFDEAVMCLEAQLQATEMREDRKLGAERPEAATPSSDSDSLTAINQNSSRSSIPVLETNKLGSEGEEGEDIHIDDLADDKGEEHVIEIRECPICHQPRLNKRSDANIITHIATCASQDWRQVNNIVMSGFVTSSQAQRKWYSKIITKISYGGYKLGANSANILVQDRITGQINEERMSVYVRLGIRLLYKGLKSNSMEKKRSECLLPILYTRHTNT
jgi:phosphatidylserine decarboxylase